MRDDPSVTDLVTSARSGDQQAWDALVERYAPLVWSICTRYRLAAADAADAGQSVWLHLVEQLDHIRDPAALPGWLATTTRRECARVARAERDPKAPVAVLDDQNIPNDQAVTAEQELLTFERHAALRAAATQLPPRSQQLLALLAADPPVPYAQISATLGIAVGSIGPLRRRCLDQLRAHPAIAGLINADAAPAISEPYNQPVTPRDRPQRPTPADQNRASLRTVQPLHDQPPVQHLGTAIYSWRSHS